MQSLASVAFSGVSKSFGPNEVLRDISFTLGPHTRAGVIGRNGAGKSTLLKLVCGELVADKGSIKRSPGNARIGYLAQEAELVDESVLAHLERRTGAGDASELLEKASAALADGAAGAEEAFADALDAYERSGAADLARRAEKSLGEVGLSAHFLERSMSTLSGGQASKVALAVILLSRFDLLLLDEPTNDLDFGGLELLEKFCLGSPLGMLIVSHDREFLERTTNSILEIDLHDRSAREFNGGWASYQHERHTMERHEQERYEEYAAKRDELKQRARTQRDWATTGVAKAKRNPRDKDKAQRDFFLNKTEKQASKARATEVALERLERVDKPWEGWDLRMELPQASRSGDIAFRLDALVAHRGEFQLGPVDLQIDSGERVAITGPNGSGKSTLLSVLLGNQVPAQGSMTKGPGVIIGDLDQTRRRLDVDARLIDVFMSLTGVDRAAARSVLAKFDLQASMVEEPAGRLSAGERTRAMLAAMMATETNCLILDEPSNHLDLEAIEQLEQALEAYTGTVIVVTHDRRMLDAIRFERTLSLDNGQVT